MDPVYFKKKVNEKELLRLLFLFENMNYHNSLITHDSFTPLTDSINNNKKTLIYRFVSMSES